MGSNRDYYESGDAMRRTKNTGLLLLGIWLVITGLLPFINLPIANLSTLLSLLALTAGVLILLDR